METEKKITYPKQVSEFAKEYTNLFIGITQAQTTIELLRKENQELKTGWNDLMPKVRYVSFLPIKDELISLYKKLEHALLIVDFDQIKDVTNDINKALGNDQTP